MPAVREAERRSPVVVSRAPAAVALASPSYPWSKEPCKGSGFQVCFSRLSACSATSAEPVVLTSANAPRGCRGRGDRLESGGCRVDARAAPARRGAGLPTQEEPSRSLGSGTDSGPRRERRASVARQSAPVILEPLRYGKRVARRAFPGTVCPVCARSHGRLERGRMACQSALQPFVDGQAYPGAGKRRQRVVGAASRSLAVGPSSSRTYVRPQAVVAGAAENLRPAVSYTGRAYLRTWTAYGRARRPAWGSVQRQIVSHRPLI